MESEPRRTVLVIDDDESILKVFKRIFERNGYSVYTAQTGKEAEQRLIEHVYDATLFDLKLPDMNGSDLLPVMEKSDPDMIRIAITGLPDSDASVIQAKTGLDAFFAKPVMPDTLLKILEIKLREKNQ